MLFYIVLLVALLALAGLFRWVSRAPERGIYTAFFASGILNTVSLGPLREKVGLTEVVVLLTWLAMLMHQSWRYQRVPLSGLQRLALLFLAAFVLVEWVSFLVNNAGYYGALTGSLVETLNITYGAMMAVTVVLLVQTPQQWKGCLVGWLVGTAVVSLVGLWAMSGSAPSWTIDEFTGRISSTLKFENQIASYLVPIMMVALVWCVTRTLRRGQRLLLVALIAGMAVTLIGTGSRTAFLLLILVALCLAIVLIWQLHNRALMKGYLGLTIISGGLALFFYVSAAMALYDGNYQLGKTPSWQRPVVMMYENITEDKGIDRTRLEQADLVLEKADVAMLIGNGPKLYGSKFHVEEIHNTYAGIYIETGLLGITTLLAFLVLSFVTVLRANAGPEMRLLFIAAGLGFVLLLAYNLTMYGLRQRTIWLMAGLLLSSATVSRNWIRQHS